MRVRGPESGFFGGRFVAVGDGSWWQAVTYCEHGFVVASYLGALWSSPNGIAWSPVQADTSDDLLSATYGNGQFFIGTVKGDWLVSEDMTRWQKRSSGSSAALTGAGVASDTLIGVGSWGLITISTPH